jgi:hypothetical protein
MNTIVLSGLVKRRAQLAGDIENAHEAPRKMVLDLESLDATHPGAVPCGQPLCGQLAADARRLSRLPCASGA